MVVTSLPSSPPVVPGTSLERLLDFDEVVGVFEGGLALLTEVEVGALEALVPDAGQREQAAPIAADVGVGGGLWGEGFGDRGLGFALECQLHFVDDAGHQGFDFLGHHSVELLDEEVLAGEWATSFAGASLAETGEWAASLSALGWHAWRQDESWRRRRE